VAEAEVDTAAMLEAAPVPIVAPALVAMVDTTTTMEVALATVAVETARMVEVNRALLTLELAAKDKEVTLSVRATGTAHLATLTILLPASNACVADLPNHAMLLQDQHMAPCLHSSNHLSGQEV